MKSIKSMKPAYAPMHGPTMAHRVELELLWRPQEAWTGPSWTLGSSSSADIEQSETHSSAQFQPEGLLCRGH